jgi:hypothetical protein
MGWVVYLEGSISSRCTMIVKVEPCERPRPQVVASPPPMDLVDRLTASARELDAPPQYECTDHVKCRGEPLATPIYWQGRQWAVTSAGIECRDGLYYIGSHRCWEDEHSVWAAGLHTCPKRNGWTFPTLRRRFALRGAMRNIE